MEVDAVMEMSLLGMVGGMSVSCTHVNLLGARGWTLG